MSRLSEKCACGAEVAVDAGITASQAQEIIKDWRKNHRHEIRRAGSVYPMYGNVSP